MRSIPSGLFFKWGSLFIFLQLCLVSFSAGSDPTGHVVRVRITNATDTVFFLNHYSGKDIVNDDTAKRTHDGYLIFSGPDHLEEGLYFISSGQRYRYFDFFVGGNQVLHFEADCAGLPCNITTSDTGENKKYFQALLYLESKVKTQADPHKDSLQYLLSHVDFSDQGTRKICEKSGREGSLGDKYIRASIPPAVFQKFFEQAEKGKDNASVKFYLDHFFDNFDFADHRLINTPVLAKRIDEYIDTLSSQPLEAMLAGVDRLISLSAADAKTQAYVAWQLISRFETYYFLPGNDELYVHIVNDFLLKGKVAWYYPEVKERELLQVKKLEPLLNGRTAPNLDMPDSNAVFRELYALKARYTLLLFWASTCSHCRDEMPSIIRFYKDFHPEYQLEIFGVSTDTSVIRWKSYIRRHKLEWVNVYGRKNAHGSYHELYNIQSTPVIFLLDEKKKIIAKYLKPEEFGLIIKNREAQLKGLLPKVGE